MTPPARRPRLFDALPSLRARVPWVDLGLEESPVERLAALGAELGHGRLWIKRDDLVSPLYGGNKGRKLEFLLAEALDLEARTVIALGTTGSHQCVANAAFAGALGLHPVSAVVPQPPGPAVRRNLLLGLHFGAEFLWAPDDAILGAAVAERLRAEPACHLTAPGGSTPPGNLGFVEAALELGAQVARGELPAPDRIFVAGASTGSAAGLRLGLRLAGLPSRVHVVKVSADRWCTPEILARHEADLRSLLGREAPGDAAPAVFDASCFGAGYALATPEGEAARRRLRALEGIELDACYTAKVVAGLCRYVERGGPRVRDETLLFWHTANGRDFREELGACDYRRLPPALHPLFEAAPPDPAAA